MHIPRLLKLPPNRVWRTYPGGMILDEMEGKPNPGDSHFPEDWIASTTLAHNAGRDHYKREGLSKLEIQGQTLYLTDLIEAFPEDITGRKHYEKYGPNTQLLVKLLDSAIRLHIQVHPTIPFARKFLNSNSGKTEAYIILGSRAEITEPYIYLGLQHPMSRERFKNAVLKQDIRSILSCFEKIPVHSGDVFIVPGGLPHAIGEGVFMIEIMEPTDYAVRLEFEKGGYVLPENARFMGRDVDFALDMMDFTPRSVDQVKSDYFCRPQQLTSDGMSEESVLISPHQTPCFSVHRLSVSKKYIRSSQGFHLGIVTDGEGTITSGNDSISVKKWDKYLVTSQSREVAYSSRHKMDVVLAFPPK
jgi:mannose-6-phosphate isomerase